MAQLTFSEQPGIVDLADATFDQDNPVTDHSLKQINHNAKFAAVRCEIIYMGFYKNGNTIGLPISPVDGYTYSRAELLFIWMRYSNRAPGAGFVSGQKAPPPVANSQAANLYHLGPWDINDATGVVSLQTTYYTPGGAETVTSDGIIKVYAVCQRLSVNVAS